MMETIFNKLKNVIAAKRFVNCFSREFSPGNQEALEPFLSKLKEEYKSILYVDMDIREFRDFEEEEQEAKVLLELINREFAGKGLPVIDTQAISIAHALHKWSNELNRQALAVFHCFHDRHDETEKNILRSLRKTVRNRDEMSSYSGVLIVSNKKVSTWKLFPESDLDERHVAFFEL